MVSGCRTTGLIQASAKLLTGKYKIVSIHGFNVAAGHASNNPEADFAIHATFYDNTAASGTPLCAFTIPAGRSLEFDMHGAQLTKGLYVHINTDPFSTGNAGSGGITVEYI